MNKKKWKSKNEYNSILNLVRVYEKKLQREGF